MANRLINSTSPYLLQHANNPVDWYPWGEEALARAKAEQKPIFLSIGYAACHWCHVMEHLVFERADIAALMNRDFINIKVDREERPDLDDLYMLATQMMTGQGGWPMSVWLTPDLKPFYAGTYFPPDDAYGRPGFPRLLLALADAWKNKREGLLSQAEKVVEAIRIHADEGQSQNPKTENPKPTDVPLPMWLRLAVEQAADRFDEVNGGLGGAPKFPPHQQLALWLELVGREQQTPLSAQDRALLGSKITKTLDGMMNGGIYDHVGGAFARYSTDERWLVPHFEKMLYDSAQLAPVYAGASAMFGQKAYARIARETLDFFLREMMSPEGAFYSSLDADSEGEEGKYYVWTLEDIRAALNADVFGDEGLEKIVSRFGLTAHGNWHESPVKGASVLAVNENGALHDEQIEELLKKMRDYREKRERPRLDDKILTAWNGLMLSALAITGKYLPDKGYLADARRLADFLLTHHMKDGTLLRVSRNGPAHTPGFLDDHAFLLQGLLDLIDADADGPYRDRATQIADAMLEQFEDKEHGGFFFTGPNHEQLFSRMKNAADNATPSPNGVAIRALLRLAQRTGHDKYRNAALRAVATFFENIDRRPEYFPTLLLGLLEAGTGLAAPDTPAARPTTGPAGDGTVALAVTGVEPGAEPLSFTVTFRVTVAAGYHIQPAEKAEAGILQTTARLRALDRTRIAAQQWTFPPPGPAGYSGEFHIRVTVTLTNPEAGRHEFRATLMAQPCSETACLEPVTASSEFGIEME